MAYYQDMMDPDRVVQVTNLADTQKCRVFWRTKNGYVFGGTAPIPASLFADTLLNKRLGFQPLNWKD